MNALYQSSAFRSRRGDVSCRSLRAIEMTWMTLATLGLVLTCVAHVPVPLAGQSAGAAAPRLITSPDAAGPVRPGIEVFLANLPPTVRGKRVGLITNQSAIDREGTSDIDLDRAPRRRSAGGAPRPRARHPRRRRGRREDRRRDRCPDGRARVLPLQGRGPRSYTRHAERRGRPPVRPAGSGRTHLDVCVHDGAVDAGGFTKADPVRGARSPQSHRRRDCRGSAARPEVQELRRDVPHSGTSRDDGGRAGVALQPEVRHRCGSRSSHPWRTGGVRSGRTRPACPG